MDQVDIGMAYIEDGKNIFALPQAGTVVRIYVVIMAAEAPHGTKIDGETEEEGNDPGNQDNIVVIADMFNNADTGDHPRGDEDGSQD